MIRRLLLSTLALLVVCSACTDQPAGLASPDESPGAIAAHRFNGGSPAPAGLVSVPLRERSISLWPFTGTDVSGNAGDPINLVFTGQADPRDIRAALMGLGGDRAAFGFPASAPFDCRWSDTPSGGVQSGYSAEAGWIGGAIQLQCGDFAPVRFHMRLFRSGQVTIASAHFEVLIPGTTTHQVLSWELAEQLVTADMMRTGLLDAAAPLGSTGAINGAPTYQVIPAVIFNSLPGALQAVAAGAPGNVSADVGIASDGAATMVNVRRRATRRPPDVERSFTVMFDQVIPKPFCGGPTDYVYVNGPITLHETARIGRDGGYESSFRAEARLQVTPVNPMTGQPSAATFSADVTEAHSSLYGNDRERTSSRLTQALLPTSASGHGRLVQELDIDTRGRIAVAATVLNCTP